MMHLLTMVHSNFNQKWLVMAMSGLNLCEIMPLLAQLVASHPIGKHMAIMPLLV